MSSVAISLIALVCISGGAVLGLYLRRVLPEGHLDSESKDSVKLAMGLIATLAALVLGLLISAAKNSFDRVNTEITEGAAKIVHLDSILELYGPETKDIRDMLKGLFSGAVEAIVSGDESQLRKLDTPERTAQLAAIKTKILALSPKTEQQRWLQSRAIELNEESSTIRWLVILQLSGGVPMILLTVMVVWLSIIFAGWAIFAPRNPTVTSALLTSAVCVSGAIFLLLEMDSPLTGFIRISSVPLEVAVSHLSH